MFLKGNAGVHYKENFDSVYSEYKVLVYNVVLNYLLSIEDAEEVTQDVFIKVYESLDTFKRESSLKTWIYRIAINKSLDFIKKKNSKKRLFIFGNKADSDYVFNNLSTFDHPGVALENKEASVILFSAINTLGENQKTAFILSKIDGLSNPKIAAIMQLSVGAVESLQVRAKKALKIILGKKFEEYRRK